MGTLHIVANAEGYGIFDIDQKRMMIKGLHSFRGALTAYERLVSLQESTLRYTRWPCQNRYGRAAA